MVHAAVALLVRSKFLTYQTNNTSTDSSADSRDLCRYIADYVYALPTVAFFMSVIGIFIIGHFTSQVLGYRRFKGPRIWHRFIALIRYLSYRGFHVRSLRWNSAPVGVLLLGTAGTVFFFCQSSLRLALLLRY